MNQQRWLTLISLVIIVPVGFYTKFYEGPAAVWVRFSLGGVFYEIFFCLLFFFIFPKAHSGVIAGGVLLVTCLLEFLQLWHPPLLELIRSNFFGRTLLGNSFCWSDFPYYFIGSGLGWIWLDWLRQFGGMRNIRS